MTGSDKFDSEFIDNSDYSGPGNKYYGAIGSRVQLYERLRKKLDSKGGIGHTTRVNIGNRLVKITPTWQNENIDPGTLAGAMVAAISTTIDDFAPVDIASSAEIAGSEPIEGGAKYTVNVDGVLPQQARFMAMMDAGTGFTSLFTDKMDVKEVGALRKRIGRSTWQFEVIVMDTAEDNDPLGPTPLGLRGSSRRPRLRD